MKRDTTPNSHGAYMCMFSALINAGPINLLCTMWPHSLPMWSFVIFPVRGLASVCIRLPAVDSFYKNKPHLPLFG